MNSLRAPLVKAAIVSMALVLPAIAPSRAHANAAIDALQQTPLSLLSYGVAQLSGFIQQQFSGTSAPQFAAPLSGNIADISTVVFNPDTGMIYITLVNLTKLPEGVTPGEECQQAMTALRTAALLDPATGQLQPGMDSSLFSSGFAVAGTTVENAPGNYLATLDQAIVLRFSGLGDKRFVCRAPLLGTGFSMEE